MISSDIKYIPSIYKRPRWWNTLYRLQTDRLLKIPYLTFYKKLEHNYYRTKLRSGTYIYINVRELKLFKIK